MAHNENPIGVFDSGVGGLTVVRALRAVLPGENLVYLGDTARVPYGSKSAETVQRYSLACTQFLLEQRVKLILVACNTASAQALPALLDVVPVPLIGAVEPGAKSAHAATKSRHIGVLGTLGTIRSGAYETVLRGLNPDNVVTGQACPLLVPLAEEGWLNGDIVEAIIARYVGELAARDPLIDTVVLGCTHYPLLLAPMAAVCERVFQRTVVLVDSSTAMAALALEQLIMTVGMRKFDGRPGDLRCFVTDATRLDDLGTRFLGEPLSTVNVVDL